MEARHQAELALVDLARNGDRGAQQTLWLRHRRWVAAIVLAHRPNAVEVDDLMQEVAIKFVAKLAGLRDVGAFRPWLRRIVINVCRGAARGLHPTLQISAGSEAVRGASRGGPAAAEPGSRQRGHAEIVETTEAAHGLLDQLLSLPSAYREPLLLRVMQALSYQQISEILDLPVTTVETRLARARRMLRQELSPEALESWTA